MIVSSLLCCAEFVGVFCLILLCGGWIDFTQIDFIEVGRFCYEKADSQIGDRRYMMDGGV